MSQSLPAVLLLDDEVRSVESMARILSEEFEVFIATQAEQALSILQEQHIQVILADQRMPTMTGVEFLSGHDLKALKKRLSIQVPITLS
jgi:two-component system response regulator HupR/HoxA